MTPLILKAYAAISDNKIKVLLEPDECIWMDIEAAQQSRSALKIPEAITTSALRLPFEKTAFVMESLDGSPIIVRVMSQQEFYEETKARKEKTISESMGKSLEYMKDEMLTSVICYCATPNNDLFSVHNLIGDLHGKVKSGGGKAISGGVPTELSKVEMDDRQKVVEMALLTYQYASTRLSIPTFKLSPNPKNAKRIARGKKPLFDWHTVRIDPKPLPAPVAELSEPTGIKHRQHDVRGHWCVRHSTGKRYWRNAHKRGDASLGVIFKSYEVGKRIDTIPTVT